MRRDEWIGCTVLCCTLAACGKPDPPATSDGEAATAVLESPLAASAETGGGPTSIEGVVLIRDVTLDGRCVFADPADAWPGTTVASVQLFDVHGRVKGHGRMLWDEAGFEVATERGTPPDGIEFAGDSCTDAYNLGCDGRAVFELVGGGGRVQKIRTGDRLIVHYRGRQACGEALADEIEAAICHDSAAAASGRLESCTSRVRMIEARSDVHGPDRISGTINNLPDP